MTQGLAQLPPQTDNLAREKARIKLLDDSFAEIAAKESACPSSKQGGDLGWFTRAGSVVEPFAIVAFALSGVLAGFVSLYVVAQGGSVSYKMGVNIVLVAFVASVIGGVGSLPGAALGGFLLGLVSVALQAFLPEGWRPYRDAFVFLLFIAFLLWRPQGLLSRRADRERV